ncbi:phage portal protein [Alkanindiges illinoisensis]|uniref:phage portal protein n=1 Tax=Alkanindiges illinoisensis TaxID=197183 RepID=UPI00047D4541|nr:phage portal protein [Alkanindiges illinoisensis]
MATASGGKVTALAADFVQRVAAGFHTAITGKAPDWFGPSDPTPAVAPEGTAGRQFDYGTGINMNNTPRQGELFGFNVMRTLADSSDLLRVIIERRKDQIVRMDWTIKVRDKAGTVGDESATPDPRCDQVAEFLRFPDLEHDWATWLRMLLEDLLVIDAPTVYPRKTKGGDLYSLEPVDGATIKRVLDVYGRTPINGETAYQQILKGMPAVDYAHNELFYLPRNPRTHKVYGYSPVEQIVNIITLALNRQTYQTAYYTDGSTPDLIFQVPDAWTVEQTKQFTDWWNDLLSGNLTERRKTRFVPNGVKPVDTKEKALTDQADEWIARVACFAFGISPHGFVKEVNRATAETAQQASQSEGLAPLMMWVKSMMDRIISAYFGSDLEFIWQSDEMVAPKDQAEIDSKYVTAKILTADEVRAKRFGLGALPKEMSPDPPADPEQPDPPEANPAKEKVAKAKKPVSLINRDRAIVTETVTAIQAELVSFFAVESELLASDVIAALEAEALGKATDNNGIIGKILNTLSFGRWQTLVDGFKARLQVVALDGVNEAFFQVGIDPENMEDALSLANQKAIDYANERAAELVGMRWQNGELVENPSPLYSITESTRDMLRSKVTQAMEEGWSNDTLANEIKADYAFSAERADSIARTETAIADVEGNVAAYEESELVESKQWLTAPGCCPKCAALSGVIVPLNEYFVVGSFRKNAPLHPHCRCDILPVLKD